MPLQQLTNIRVNNEFMICYLHEDSSVYLGLLSQGLHGPELSPQPLVVKLCRRSDFCRLTLGIFCPLNYHQMPQQSWRRGYIQSDPSAAGCPC